MIEKRAEENIQNLNDLFASLNQSSEVKNSQNEFCLLLLNQIQNHRGKGSQDIQNKTHEKESNHSENIRNRSMPEKPLNELNVGGQYQPNATQNATKGNASESANPVPMNDRSKQRHPPQIKTVYSKTSEWKTDYEQPAKNQSPMDESCLIFSENNIRKRMALSISRDEDQVQVTNGNTQKGIQSKLQSGAESINMIQFKFAIEREKIYEQNLKLLKQSPDNIEYGNNTQKPIVVDHTSEKIVAGISTNPIHNSHKKEESKTCGIHISQQSPRATDLKQGIPTNMGSSSKDQSTNTANYQMIQQQLQQQLSEVTCTTPPLFQQTIMNTPRSVQNVYQQQNYIPNLNNPGSQQQQQQQQQQYYTQSNNIENTQNFKLTPTRTTAPPQFSQQSLQFQQLPISANISSSNFSAGSNLSSHRSMTNSNGNFVQNQPMQQYNHEPSSLQMLDVTKKQLNGLFQQFCNAQSSSSPNQQKYYQTPSPPDFNLGKYNMIINSYHSTTSPPLMPLPHTQNYQQDLKDLRENQILFFQQQHIKIANSGEINSIQNSNPVSHNTSQLQQNHKEESISSDTQKWNSTSSHLLKANSIEIDNANNTSASGNAANNQHSSTAKKYKTKPVKVPSDDTYNYIQTLFEIDENSSAGSNGSQSQSRILQNSNHTQSVFMHTEREKLIEEIAAAISYSSINSNSSTSLKQIKSLSSAMEDENVMAEKSKQKLKEKQLIYLCRELSQNKKVQSLELKDDRNKLNSDTHYYSQSSYIRQKCNINESGEANPVFADFASKKRLSFILQQNMIQKNEEMHPEMLTPKNVEYETCSSLEMNDS